MTYEKRIENYQKQNESVRLTPKQQRRVSKKAARELLKALGG
jgi:hypothetical protein